VVLRFPRRLVGNKDLHSPGVDWLVVPTCREAACYSVGDWFDTPSARCAAEVTVGLAPSRDSPLRDAVCCRWVRSGARDRTPHQPNRGEHDSLAPVHRRLPAIPYRSWRFSRSATMSTTKCRGAVAPALQAAPSLLASVDSQIVRRQRVTLATMAWDIRSPDFAAIDIGEVDDRHTISTNHAPATKIITLYSIP